MKRALVWVLLVVAIACLWLASADAQVCPGVNIVLRPKGYEALTVSTSAVSPTIPRGAELAMAVVETDGVRFRDDGTAPADTTGTPVAAGSGMIICPGPLPVIQFIRSGDEDATVHLSYYGR